MNSPAATFGTNSTTGSTGTARRLRFQEAVARMGTKAKETGLARVIILPGSLLLLFGFNFMIWAWWGAAHSFREIEQIPYLISGGLIGLGFVLLGALLLVSALWLTVLTRAQEQSEARFRAHLDTVLHTLQNQPANPEPAAAPRTRSRTTTSA